MYTSFIAVTSPIESWNNYVILHSKDAPSIYSPKPVLALENLSKNIKTKVWEVVAAFLDRSPDSWLALESRWMIRKDCQTSSNYPEFLALRKITENLEFIAVTLATGIHVSEFWGFGE